MKDQIIKLLEKYEDKIMEYTLGNSVDEYGERFAKVYCWEWEDHKYCIAYTIDKFIKYGIDINPIGFAYIITSEWSGVMTFDEGDLNMNGLTDICKNILMELNIK